MSETSSRTFPELSPAEVADLKAKARGASVYKIDSDLGTVYAKSPDRFLWTSYLDTTGNGAREDLLLASCMLSPNADDIKALAKEREIPAAISAIVQEIAGHAYGAMRVRSEKL